MHIHIFEKRPFENSFEPSAFTKKNPCETCSKKFHPNGMKRHIKEKHSTKQKFKCPDCSRSFSRAEHMRSHGNRCRSKVENAELLVVEAENEQQLNDELWCIEIDEYNLSR